MNQLIQDALREALNVLLAGVLPVVVVSALAGTIAAAFQSAASIKEQAIGYAARLIAVMGLLYALSSSISDSLVNLANLAFQ